MWGWMDYSISCINRWALRKWQRPPSAHLTTPSSSKKGSLSFTNAHPDSSPPPSDSITLFVRLYRLYEHVYRRVHTFASPTGYYAGPKEGTPTPSAPSSPAPGSPSPSQSAVAQSADSLGVVMPFQQGSHKVYYHVSEKETIVAWVTAGFELYATFSPLESKAVAIRACNQLLKWIKAEENSLFILDSPVW